MFAFGITKAATNYVAGTWSDRFGRKPVLVAGLADRHSRPAAADLGAVLGMGDRRQRAAGHQPGPDLVDHRHHEDRPRRTPPARPGHGLQRGRRLRRRRAHRPRWPATSPRSTGCGRPRSCSASPSRCRPRPVRGVRPRNPRPCPAGSQPPRHHPPPTPRRANRRDLHPTSFTEPALSSASQAGLVNNLNYGLAWGLFPILFATTGMPRRPHRHPRRRLPGRVGRRAKCSPAPCPTGGAANGSSPRACSSKPPASGADRHRPHASPWWRSPPRCSARAPRWSTPPCWPPSATSPTRSGGPAPSGVYRLWRDIGYAAGAIVGGIIDQHLRIARNMFAHMACNCPGINIKPAPRRSTDYDSDCFAAIKIVGCRP